MRGGQSLGSPALPSTSTLSSRSPIRSSCFSGTTISTFVDAFRKADEVLFQAVKGISDLITQNGIVNVDFADVKTVMSNMGAALMGTGIAKGQNRARIAAEMAIASPLLDDISVDGATGVLLNIVGGPDLKMKEIQEAASLVQEQAHEDANIIFGASIDESVGDSVKVTVIATGFDVAERSAGLDASAGRPTTMPQSGSVVHSRLVGSTGLRHSDVVPAARRPQPAVEAHNREVAAGVRSASRPPPPAERAQFGGSPRAAQDTFPGLENDWDVPAFQRKVPR